MRSIRASILVAACTAATVIARQGLPPEAPKFRVAVDIVAIDAVVTDRNGEIVRDLTAADFEVLQNGKRQKVTFAQFVPVTPSAPAAAERSAGKVLAPPPGEAPAAPVPPLAREQVRRTFILVVDDLGLSVEGINNTRRALREFVDTGLLPTDLVAIVRTGEARGMLQALTNDRAALRAAVDGLRYNIMSRKGVAPFGDVVQLGDGVPAAEDVTPLQRSVSAAGSLAAVNLIVQATRDLPGRKTIVLASEGFQLWEETDANKASSDDTRVRFAVDRVIDQATRSGVVIYAVDGHALRSAGLSAADDIHSADPKGKPDAMGEVLRNLAAARQRILRDAQESLAYLAEQTGGFAVLNTNDLGAGLRRIANDVRDYYVIGYEPDRDTFAAKGKTPRLHKISVNVKRAGLRVKARREFIGVSDPKPPSGPATPAQQLVLAAMSPFSSAAIALRGTNLPGYSPSRGTFVRTVLHVDAQALAFTADASGTRTASADLVGLVFDSDGAQVDTISTGFDVELQNASADETIKSGLVYTAVVPIRKPGAYQLRYAVRDRRTGAVGSFGGFVSVPDVTGGAFALSGLVLRAADRIVSESIDSDPFSLRPADALRVYTAGAQLSYSYEVYNPGRSIQIAASLWQGPDMIASLPDETVLGSAGNAVFVNGALFKLGERAPAGTYVLQLVATSDDPRGSGKVRRAVQRISFEIK
jgi:VWFA-related protein